MEMMDREQADDIDSQQVEPNREKKPSAGRRSWFRVSTASLVLLYLLILTGIIVRYILVELEKDELQTRLNNLNNSYSELQMDMKQLKDQTPEPTINRTQHEEKKLNIKTKECSEGWTKFGCSCYKKYTEKKTWSQSRADCEENRGSDLVSINSKEEQEFVTNMIQNEESWIGLRTVEDKKQPTGYKWEWVDNSSLSETSWTESPSPTDLYIVSCDQQGSFKHYRYNGGDVRAWICEK
ncbi:snaclec coagulation factor IX-binding protein subunit A-like isoform X2 [Anabas testudineus]|uniref:snaclec coagulation factor IX-binding protein subunit A-like isoform X2 n=1 Tax=Anabas testudineus TaxID=64144 RepID=UPI000E459F75|nr:snaclec coagulation factor IX-binding protein subunit A-like isoform X2 [Anabas testudineus]